MRSQTVFYTLAAASGIPTVFSHWTYSRLIVNDEVVGEPWQHIRHHNNSNAPLTNVNSTDFRCNVGASPSETYTVRAGDELGFGIDEHFGHPGIQQVYLSKAPNSGRGMDEELGPLVNIPGVYKGEEPGVLIPVFWSFLTNYTTPGPALWPEGTQEQHVAEQL
ncbi:hypothetical protein F5Y13DRAFT_183966 [Hypoxylon sp. FL1857]|nr:hypothetical protein F5Y13DRAFT_183966 [Hypoxylon sp. FL1857]